MVFPIEIKERKKKLKMRLVQQKKNIIMINSCSLTLYCAISLILFSSNLIVAIIDKNISRKMIQMKIFSENVQ